jgi:tRNA(fMet)-specific endonuclease VapC
MYLFDTDIITNIFKKQPSPRLLRRLVELPQSRQHISTVTVSEIACSMPIRYRARDVV